MLFQGSLIILFLSCSEDEEAGVLGIGRFGRDLKVAITSTAFAATQHSSCATAKRSDTVFNSRLSV